MRRYISDFCAMPIYLLDYYLVVREFFFSFLSKTRVTMTLSTLALVAVAAAAATTTVASATSLPYSEYILAPKSRTVLPVSIHSSNGSVSNPEALLQGASNGSAVFTGNASTAYDFGINIAGIVSVSVGGSVDSTGDYIGVTFSESSLWISNRSSDATADAGKDETLWFRVNATGKYTAPRDKMRGGFRYMTLVHNGTGSLEVTGAEVHYTAMPHWADDAIGNYTGYFHCDGKERFFLNVTLANGRQMSC